MKIKKKEREKLERERQEKLEREAKKLEEYYLSFA